MNIYGSQKLKGCKIKQIYFIFILYNSKFCNTFQSIALDTVKRYRFICKIRYINNDILFRYFIKSLIQQIVV